MREKKRNKRLTVGIFLLAGALITILLSSTACKDENKPATSAVKDKAKSSGELSKEQKDSDKKASDEEQKREYSYNPNGKVDPFTPLITSSPRAETASTDMPDKKDVPLTPLQKLDVDDFTLVAVISTENKLTALIEDPAVNGFIVKEGMLIGRNGGVIKRILSNSMLIEEMSVDDQGKKELKIKTITLKKK